MTEYYFKKSYITPTGNMYFVGEKFPEHYLKEKVPTLFKDFSITDEYLVASSKVSLEDTTDTIKTLNKEQIRSFSTIELKEKEDIVDTTILINEISFDDLIKIQGIGEKAATKLINNRKDNRFETVEQLTKIAPTVKWDKYTIIY
jgi:DNA uptake protein ComE-like DNA-binding protein